MRLTRSSGHAALRSLMVVRTTLPCMTPRRPWRRIRRSTVQSCHDRAFPVQLLPGLVGTVDLRVGLPDALDVGRQFRIALGTLAQSPGAMLLRCIPPVPGPGDLQHFTDRLNPMRVAVLVDELPQDLCRQSSSAWTKKALANLRISLARRSSLFSRSRVLIFSRWVGVMPSRAPVSI